MGMHESTPSSKPTYLVLRPELATKKDLFLLLVSSNLENRQFVESSAARETNFYSRWLMFISTVVRIFLGYSATALATLGWMIETALNFLSYNPTFGAFIRNLFKLTFLPPRDSEKFVSFLGYLDCRKKWDSCIKTGDGVRYFSALCMMASKAAYENQAYIRSIVKDWETVEFLGFHNCWNDDLERASTQVFFLRVKGDDHDTIVVAFRGTEPFNSDDWSTDWDFSQAQLYDPKSGTGVGNAHRGFMCALGLPKVYQDDPNFFKWPIDYEDYGTEGHRLPYYFIRNKLKEELSKNERTKYVVTGHSLGGALAILFPAILFCHDDKLLLQRLDGVYTYGQPRVGDAKFAEFMLNNIKEHNVRYSRFVYSYDMVPRLPYDDHSHWYKHFGSCYYYNCFYDAKIVETLPNKNYFSLKYTGAMLVSAFIELVRCFIIQFWKGPYYREGWLLCVSRIMGLMVPGVSDHSPQDYVNCTCLGD